MTGRLTKLATVHPRRVIAASCVLFALAAVFGVPITTKLGSSAQDFADPSSQNERADALIERAIGGSPYYGANVLLSGARPIPGDGGELRAIRRIAAMLAAQPGFQRSLDYAQTGSRTLLSRDARQTVVLAAYASDKRAVEAMRNVRAATSAQGKEARLNGMSARFGGGSLVSEELNERTIEGLERAEIFGLPIVLLLSFWFFRGVIAALLPPLVGGLSIILTFLLLRGVDTLTPISVFALNLVTGMGLGLGIDYSLFVLSRYREELASGASTAVAVERTLATAGRTVLFSSITVAAALTSLLLFPLRFLYSMGYGGALVTLCDGAVALLLLPAVLVLLGDRINALSPAFLQRRAQRTARPVHDGVWWRLASGVLRRPATVTLACAAVLLAGASPALHLRFTPPTGNLLPAAAESKEVEVALARSFPTNAAEATEIVMHGTRAQARELAGAAARAAGALAHVAPPQRLLPLVSSRPSGATAANAGRSSPRSRGAAANTVPTGARGEARAAWAIPVFPNGSPFTEAQQRLLGRLRALSRRYGALVGGATAFFADQKSSIAAHLPLALVLLVLLTACFLFLMTGSLTIPLKALLMNALSVAVGIGLIVLIFQDGHLSGLLGFKPLGGLEESSLVLMLIIAFALATDYEVFVLARIKEAHDRGLSNRDAIALGIERTGRIVTAAALLFCVAIGALGTSELFFTKQLGVGAALCVAVDATVVRALLVPALMALMGDWNWWAPRRMRRLHARLRLSESG